MGLSKFLYVLIVISNTGRDSVLIVRCIPDAVTRGRKNTVSEQKHLTLKPPAGLLSSVWQNKTVRAGGSEDMKDLKDFSKRI